MEGFTWEQLAAPGAVVASVTLLLAICKVALGAIWNPTVNGAGALVFAIGISIGITAMVGTDEPLYLALPLAAINGIVYAGAVLGVTTRYSSRIKDEEQRRLEESIAALERVEGR